MKRIPLSALGIAAALSATAVSAGSGDTWSGTNRYRDSAPIEVTTLRPGERVIVYEEGTAYAPAPVYVERTYAYQPGYVYYYEPAPAYRYADNDWVKDLNPQTGQRIGDGLFNRQGPNDFGN